MKIDYRKLTGRFLSLAERIWSAKASSLTLILFVAATILMIGGVAGASALGLPIGTCFREGHSMTWFSFFMLLITAGFSRRIWQALGGRRPDAPQLWRWLSILFLFLALDEVFKIHETLDHRLCDIFGWDRNGWADHIDDGLILVYGIVAAGLLLAHWREALRFTIAWPHFALAVVAAISTVALDFLGGEKRFVASMIGHADVKLVGDVLDIIEESFKIYGEIFFMGAFSRLYQSVRGAQNKAAEDSSISPSLQSEPHSSRG